MKCFANLLLTVLARSLSLFRRYDIFDVVTGEPVWYAEESSDCCCRCCFKPFHEKTLNIVDVRPGMPRDSLVMQAHSPCRFNCCACCDLCKTKVDLKDPSGQLLGTSDQPCCAGGCTPTLELMDRSGRPFSTLQGGSCIVGGLVELFSDIDFLYMANNGGRAGPPLARVRKIKPHGGEAMLKEALGDADLYSIELPPDASVEQKAAFIANALILVSFPWRC